MVLRRWLVAAVIVGCVLAPLATMADPPCCQGDCNGDGVVRINELLVMVGIALGSEQLSACAHGEDCPCSGPGDICDELFMIRAVDDALYGCPQ